MGATLSAFTGREQTSYVANVMAKDTGKSVDLLADVLLNPSLEDKAVEKAKEVILGQLGQVRSSACNARAAASGC